MINYPLRPINGGKLGVNVHFCGRFIRIGLEQSRDSGSKGAESLPG